MAPSAQLKRLTLGWMVKMVHAWVSTFDFIAILEPMTKPSRIPMMGAGQICRTAEMNFISVQLRL